MRPRPAPPAGPHLVVGLARSGIAAALALARVGERVIAVDRGTPDVDVLRAADVEVHLDSDGVSLLGEVRSVIKSPGVAPGVPVLAAARARGLSVIGELELAWRMLPNEFIAVTGTNGKTTTVELIGHIHREAARPAVVAGNVGTALSALVGELPGETTVVCEASSFQLEDTAAFAPEAAVLLNLSPDHLDRHASMAAYRAAKLRVFVNQGNDDIAVAPLGLGVDDLGGCARRVCFGAGLGAELAERSGQLWWGERPLIAVGELSLRGAHNVHNAMAAAAVTLARGLEPEAVSAALRSFAGVAHRLEHVALREGVNWVNDSKATNVESTRVALSAFPPSSVHLILGGLGKDQDFVALCAPVADACRAAYLIGRDAELIGAALQPSGVPLRHCGTLEHAVAQARRCARVGETVLLSPACASYDQFTDFEVRGDRFRDLARGQ